jgi:F-type H+-transporting ATPase subunit alpha
VRRNTSILKDIGSTGALSDENEAQLGKVVDDFVATFLRSEGTELHTDSSISDGEDVDVEQEQIVAKKKK